jgi:hypothetical protein
VDINKAVVGKRCVYPLDGAWQFIECGIIMKVNKDDGIISIYNDEKDELLRLASGWVRMEE